MAAKRTNNFRPEVRTALREMRDFGSATEADTIFLLLLGAKLVLSRALNVKVEDVENEFAIGALRRGEA